MTTAPSSKRCSDCRAIKPHSEYYAHPRSADRLHHVCKPCQRRRMKERRMNFPIVQERDRARNKLRKNKPEDRCDSIARHAHTTVNNAVRDGRLTKGPCVNCGAASRIHGHHRDYSKPLEVIWLCARCHSRLHAGHSEINIGEHHARN